MIPKVFVLRWGHRPRDFRLTTHVFLTARAFGASGFYLSDVTDNTLQKSMEKTIKEWGGDFEFKIGIPWREILQKMKGTVTIVHLTMYGENIEKSKVMKKIKKRGCDILVIVGSRKVPAEFYSISDFNVAVGNQPHSEVAALSIFLDRYFEGKELLMTFKGAQKKVIPSSRHKRLQQ